MANDNVLFLKKKNILSIIDFEKKFFKMKKLEQEFF